MQTITITVQNEAGRVIGKALVPSTDAMADATTMIGAVEVRQAVARGREVDADRLFELVTGRKPPRSAFYLIGRYMAAKWRLSAKGGEAAVEKRLQKQGIRPSIVQLILKGWAS